MKYLLIGVALAEAFRVWNIDRHAQIGISLVVLTVMVLYELSK